MDPLKNTAVLLELPRMQVQSSNLKSVGYDSETSTLVIEFKNQSTMYAYNPVTEEGYKGLLNADSKGEFFKKNIRDNSNIKYAQIRGQQS